MSASTVSASVSVTTSLSTVTSTIDQTTSTSTSEFTTSTILTTSIPPSTTIIQPTSSSAESTTFVEVTSAFTPPITNPTQSPTIVIITSTLPPLTSEQPSTTSTSETSTATSSSPSALSPGDSALSKSSGLGTGGKIAIAVVIPVVVVAALIIFGLWFWRKRKARKFNEELRKNEMAEYGFNPNHDPTLAAAGVAGAAGITGAAYGEDASESPEEKSGYRGWGATSSGRKASTTLGSASRPAGMATSDNGSQPGGYQYSGSSPATNPSDHYSSDPLHPHAELGDSVGAMGTGAVATGLVRHRSGNNGDIRRGPSNASSAYSNGPPHSEGSDDVPGVPNHYYEQEVPYNIYNDSENQGGPYGDGSYGGAGVQPIIRDVQARRNTRIERAPTMPQTQGGIAQNF